jgi:hypothetical protein
MSTYERRAVDPIGEGHPSFAGLPPVPLKAPQQAPVASGPSHWADTLRCVVSDIQALCRDMETAARRERRTSRRDKRRRRVSGDNLLKDFFSLPAEPDEPNSIPGDYDFDDGQ